MIHRIGAAFALVLAVMQANLPLDSAAVAGSPMPAYGSWHSSRIGGGGYLQGITFCPSDPKRVYVIVDVSGPYRSDDGGKNWRMLEGGFPAARGNYTARGLIVDPRNANKLIVANGSKWAPPEGVYLSDDGGETWTKTLSASFINGETRVDGQILARDPNHPDTVLAASVGTGVFRSTDDGKTWKNVGLPDLQPTEIFFDGHQPDRVFMCALAGKDTVDSKPHDFGGGFFRSTDDGQTWSKVSEIGPRELHQSPAQKDKLYGIFDHASIRVSTDGGDTWDDFSQGLLQKTTPLPKGVNPKDVAYLAMDAGPDFLLTASAYGTVYRRGLSDDHWQKVERQSVDAGDWWGGASRFGIGLGFIEVDPRDVNHWLFTDWYAMWQTFDAGKNWKLTIDGIESTVIHNLSQDPSDPGVVHLGMGDDGYFVSTDGGETFHRGGSGITNNIKDIAVCRRLPSRLYAIGTKTFKYEAGQFFVSVNRGEEWVRSPMEGLPDMSDNKFNTVVADAENPYSLVVAVSGPVQPGAGGAYRSTDGGKSFQWIGAGLPAGGFFNSSIWASGRELAMGPDGKMIAVSPASNLVYRFDPAERQWKKADLKATGGQAFNVVADPFVPGRFLVSMSDAGLFLTDDAGATWKKVFDGTVRYASADCATKGRFAASTADGVILSTDGGGTWSVLDRHLPERNLYNMSAFAGDRLIVGSNGSGVFWTDLLEPGKSPVAAKPAVPAYATPADPNVPQFQTIDGETGTDLPPFWKLSGTKAESRASLDTRSVKDAKASVCLETLTGSTKGSLVQTVETTASSFTIAGYAKAEGDSIQQAVITVQGFGDGQAKPLVSTKAVELTPNQDWQPFSRQIILPQGTVKVSIDLVLNGEGKLWLDSLRVSPAGGIYLPTPTPDSEATPLNSFDPAAADALPKLINPDMTDGTDTPTGWKITFNPAGKLALHRDVADFKNAPASLRLESVDGPAYGTATQALPKELRTFQIKGFAKSSGGALQQAMIVVQGTDAKGKQVSFKTVAQVQKALYWQAFSQNITLPDEAVAASLGVILKGDGKIWLDELTLAPAEK